MWHRGVHISTANIMDQVDEDENRAVYMGDAVTLRRTNNGVSFTKPFAGINLENPDTEIPLGVAPHGALSPELMPEQIQTPTGSPPIWWVAIFDEHWHTSTEQMVLLTGEMVVDYETGMPGFRYLCIRAGWEAVEPLCAEWEIHALTMIGRNMLVICNTRLGREYRDDR